MKRRRFTAEFKKDAASLLIIDGLSLKEASSQLGVCQQQLSRWKKEYLELAEAEAPEGARSPKAMCAEIEELRKQLAKSERMNQILKKTVGYFSKED